MTTNCDTAKPDPTEGTRVVGDIGGTHARFALLTDGAVPLQSIECFRCVDHETLEHAIRAYLDGEGLDAVQSICLAVAGPVDRDVVELPNNPWAFSRSSLEATLGTALTVVNDFTAQALSLDLLESDDLRWIGAPRPDRLGGVQSVLGPGTGLGVALRLASGEVLPSEGGHVAFAPTTAHEIELLGSLRARYGRVSVERFLSGPGLENIFRGNRELAGYVGSGDEDGPSAATIARKAGCEESIARRSVLDFLDILASYAGDVALFSWSRGGVFLTGGVLRRLAPFLDPVRFRSRFEDKGRLAGFLQEMPLAWIDHPNPGLLGCAALLRRSGPGNPERVSDRTRSDLGATPRRVGR